ncbi:MAG: bifunctional diguanylate cyclase/phosphodiesterase [Gammaproteobacteria bacterium]|nr:bifunctional diguanylate cyclase/phosphodiesterase [Gammaproteobacteria bacterium]
MHSFFARIRLPIAAMMLTLSMGLLTAPATAADGLEALSVQLRDIQHGLRSGLSVESPAFKSLLSAALSQSEAVGSGLQSTEFAALLRIELEQVGQLIRVAQSDTESKASLIRLSERKLGFLLQSISDYRAELASISTPDPVPPDTAFDGNSTLDPVAWLQQLKNPLPMLSALPEIASGWLPERDQWSEWFMALSEPSVWGTVLGGCLVVLMMLWWSSRRSHQASDLQKTLDSLPDAVALYDASGQLQTINRKLLKMLPLETTPQALTETTSSDLYAQLSPDNLAIEKARNRARDNLDDPNATLNFELPSYGRTSLLIKERLTEDGGTAITVHGTDKQRVAQQTDPLTALPTRNHLLNELAQRCSRTKDQLALIVVDLRGFRQINDSYGSSGGDELLKQTAICLQHCMPEEAMIARTAGDEFAVLVELDDRDGIERRVQGFLATLRCGLRVQSMNLPVRACIGIAYAPEHGNTVSSLLKCADSACAQAKRLGNNSFMVYSSEQQLAAKRRHQLEVGLLQAIRKNELSLQYQPQIDIKSRMTCGMEALLRWQSEELGRVSPAEFIHVAEQTGIISRLGMWVLRQAISDYHRLAQFGTSPTTLSVNLSRKQFGSGRIVEDISKLLDQTGFDPSKLCLEITETALFNDSSRLRTLLHQLTDLGMKLAIDDFGVGYSSLLELRDFPISEVKIDRAFVMDVATNPNSQEIIRAIVGIAESIGAEVVAEGIENQEQFDLIADLGCHRAQGYYLCEPMPVTTFPDVVLGA